jgi:hypothetical protein
VQRDNQSVSDATGPPSLSNIDPLQLAGAAQSACSMFSGSESDRQELFGVSGCEIYSLTENDNYGLPLDPFAPADF